ncbi:FAD-binding oxidoreductase, partial [Peribacillus sp. NPDC058002]|uniref:FAD-binding oxidoreductase n=1 Tax=Peribacillus sp. NPDC058002 TaxID=3346301 RepID=UPI0036DB41F3
AYIHGYPGKKLMVTDVCLPISDLSGAIQHARETVDFLGLTGGIVGHVGDGNYHVLLMIDNKNLEEIKRAEQLNEQIVLYALERNGTCTGEHGVGVGKQKYQKKEHGNSLFVMEKIKVALDPDNLLNPSKIFMQERV